MMLDLISPDLRKSEGDKGEGSPNFSFPNLLFDIHNSSLLPPIVPHVTSHYRLNPSPTSPLLHAHLPPSFKYTKIQSHGISLYLIEFLNIYTIILTY